MPLNPPLGDADDIWIDADERGFQLHFETEQGRFHVNIHGCSLTLLEQVDKQLRPYWQEAEDARETMSADEDEDEMDKTEPDDWRERIHERVNRPW